MHLFKFRKRFGLSHTNPPNVLVGAENRIQGGVEVNRKKSCFLCSPHPTTAHTFVPVDFFGLPLDFHSGVFASIFLIFKTEMSRSRAPSSGM